LPLREYRRPNAVRGPGLLPQPRLVPQVKALLQRDDSLVVVGAMHLVGRQD
jgi:hypothetical protein